MCSIVLIGFVYGIDYYAIQSADRFNLLDDVYQLRMIRIQRLFLPSSQRTIFWQTFTLDILKIEKSRLDPTHVKIASHEISCYMAQTQPQKA